MEILITSIAKSSLPSPPAVGESLSVTAALFTPRGAVMDKVRSSSRKKQFKSFVLDSKTLPKMRFS